MKKAAHLAETLVFLIFLGLFFVLHLLLPDSDFSQQENRSLQTLPGFTFSDFFSGKFTSSFEDYITDQFVLRDRWTVLKARCQLIAGKSENNGVYLCNGETLIEPYTAPDTSDFEFSLDAVNALSSTADVPVYFALIPSASDIWAEKLPVGAPNDSQLETIDYAYRYVRAATADIYTALASHADEPIYYRTDHHWTTLGAYYGYTALAEAMGIDPIPLSDYTETLVTDCFYGTGVSASGFHWVQPDSISTYVTQGNAIITNYPEGAPVSGKLYEESYLSVKDKYSYFYGGNTPKLIIESGNAEAPSLLILRDSYMDSLSPYLMAHFSEIHILDLRYYKMSILDYITEHGIDNVLVCYNVKNFVTDSNLFLMAY